MNAKKKKKDDSTPPAAGFGHSRLADFLLAPGHFHLNHGAFGASPRVVLAENDRWRAVMEGDPSTFYRRDLPGLLRRAADRVARLLGGRGEDWVFVENTTAGVNAVAGSLPLKPGDEVICFSQVYGAVGNALRYHAERAGARVVRVQIPVPFVDPEPLFSALRAAISNKTRLAVVEHVTSPGATLLPVKELVAICRNAGAAVLIDGAHAVGMVPMEVPSIGADWYVGSLHKWAFAPKGSGVLWCKPERQAALHPVSISHYLGQGFTAEFDYSGTKDNSAWLSVPAALDYMDSLGVEAMRAYNNRLAGQAADMLAREWKSIISADGRYRAAMASVKMPNSEGGDRIKGRRLAVRLAEEHKISLGIMAIDGGFWVRISAQVYNQLSDYELLAKVGGTLSF